MSKPLKYYIRKSHMLNRGCKRGTSIKYMTMYDYSCSIRSYWYRDTEKNLPISTYSMIIKPINKISRCTFPTLYNRSVMLDIYIYQGTT